MSQTRRQYGRRCSYCYEMGHNRRTCQAYTNYLKHNIEVFNSTVNPFWIKTYVKRTGKMPDGSEPTGDLAEIKKTAKKASRRRCSWCVKMRMVGGGYGHNRRTCPHRKVWHADQKRDTRDLRQAILNRAEALGVGMGSLVVDKKYLYDGSDFHWREVVGMVVKVDWDAIDTTKLKDHPVITVHWQNLPAEERYTPKVESFDIPRSWIPEAVAKRGWNLGQDTLKMLGKSSNPLLTCPKDWLERPIVLDEVA